MSSRPARRRLVGVAPFLASLAALALPAPALAHLPSIGLGPVYDGVFHLLLSPEDVLTVTALALYCGQRGAPFGRRALWVLPLAWIAGGMLGMLVPGAHGSAFGWLSLLMLGALVAADARLSLPLVTALALLVALFHGYRNGVGLNPHGDGPYALAGIAIAVCVLLALGSSLVIPLQRTWTRIAVRVAGSWIAASGLLLLGWTLRAAG